MPPWVYLHPGICHPEVYPWCTPVTPWGIPKVYTRHTLVYIGLSASHNPGLMVYIGLSASPNPGITVNIGLSASYNPGITVRIGLPASHNPGITVRRESSGHPFHCWSMLLAWWEETIPGPMSGEERRGVRVNVSNGIMLRRGEVKDR